MDIEKLDIKDGDILVLRAAWETSKVADLEQILNEKGFKDILIIILEEGENLSSLNEEAMKKEGWIKA